MNTDIVVMIPGKYGVEMVDLSLLIQNLYDDDAVDLDEVISNSAMDMLSGGADEQMVEHWGRLRQANEDGDWGAYWGIKAKDG